MPDNKELIGPPVSLHDGKPIDEEPCEPDTRDEKKGWGEGKGIVNSSFGDPIKSAEKGIAGE